jgi:hypothetical protein
MTIAIGILAADSIVLATDTEESIPGYMKLHQYKTRGGAKGTRGCLIAGAGSANYIDTVSDELIETFFSESEDEKVGPAFNRVVAEFYQMRVVPFAQYPAVERPDFDLLIAFAGHDKHYLWATEKSAMREVYPWEAIGSGAMFAKMLLGQFYANPTAIPTHVAELLAAYVVYRVKDTIDGCGKHTFVQTLREGRATHREIEEVDEWERLFRMFDGVAAAALMRVLGDDGENTEVQASRSFNTLRKKFAEVIQRVPREV